MPAPSFETQNPSDLNFRLTERKYEYLAGQHSRNHLEPK